MSGAARVTAALRDAAEHPALVPYITAGYPTLGATTALLLACQRAGAAVIELGVPFSDPLADGPTIQQSSQQALEAGMTPQLAFDQVAQARTAGVHVPVAVMTYTNIVLSADAHRFCADGAAAGIDALIVPDLPLDESAEIAAAAAGSGLALIPLVAPTTPDDRLARACAAATGFVYCVGVVGVTGARERVSEEALALLDRVGSHTDLPRALGFGLSRRAHLEALRGHAEAAVVGSALISALRGASDPPAAAERFLRGLRNEVHA